MVGLRSITLPLIHAGIQANNPVLEERNSIGMAAERTEHPHIIRDPDILGGEPVVDGTRTSVRHVVLLYRAGQEPEEIARTYHLLLGEVYDAISYYYDHESEISRYIIYEGAPKS
jgi:uncharacterized protein (DUF433 family)